MIASARTEKKRISTTIASPTQVASSVGVGVKPRFCRRGDRRDERKAIFPGRREAGAMIGGGCGVQADCDRSSFLSWIHLMNKIYASPVPDFESP